jgi:hypothetical protein
MPIVITPNIPPAAAQSVSTADIVLQAGSVISARVLQILGNDQVRIAIGGQAIDVISQVPLQAGQTLQLQVSQTDNGIRLAVVNQQGAAGSQGFADAASITLAPEAAAINSALATPGSTATAGQLTPLETLAVSIAAQAAATQQTSLAPLFANLAAAVGLPALPPQVQQAVAGLLAQRTSLDLNLTGSDIKQAFQTSGLFLEASLASGSIPSPNAAPDLKAALIVLRQVLESSLANVTEAATSGASVAASAVQSGVTPSVVPQGAAPAQVAVQIPTPRDSASQGSAAANVVQRETTLTITATPQTGQPAIQPSPQIVAIVAGGQTPLVASPAIAPQLAAPEAMPTAAAQAAAPVTSQEIIDLASANQIVPPPSTPDALARATASSVALNLLQEALQANPFAAGNASRLVFENGQALSLIQVVSGARPSAMDDAELVRTNLPPPPINGALPSAQPVASATLVPHLPPEVTLQHLLTDTDAAIARQTLLQVASLPGQADTMAGRTDPTVPRWNFEIPFATPQGTAMAQFEISRDGGGDAVASAKRVWRARFSLDIEPAGPIHALVSLNGERTSVRMWAERPATASQLRAGVSQLSQALSRADLQPGDIVVRDGAPSQAPSAPAGHFLDRAL